MTPSTYDEKLTVWRVYVNSNKARKSIIIHKSDTKAVLSCSDKGHPSSRPNESPISVVMHTVLLMHNSNTNVFVSGSHILQLNVL